MDEKKMMTALEKISDENDGVLLVHPETPEGKARDAAAARAELDQLTAELIEAAGNQKKNWLTVGRLIRRIEEKELFRAARYKSMSAFINNLAVKYNLHRSVLRDAQRAERVVHDYNARHPNAQLDESTPGVDMNTLVKIDSIAQNTAKVEKLEVKDALIRKTVAGKLNRRDIFEAYKTVHARRRLASRAPAGAEPTKQNEAGITAEDCVEALTNQIWLIGEAMRPQSIQTKYDRPQWLLQTEFPVETETAQRVRRMDALIIENQLWQKRSGSYHHVFLHAVEIKVSERDLLNDGKMAEYTPFCDYFYIAVPEELVPAAESFRAPGWGIIAISVSRDGDGDPVPVARIVQPAEYRPGERRAETLEFAVLKLM